MEAGKAPARRTELRKHPLPRLIKHPKQRLIKHPTEAEKPPARHRLGERWIGYGTLQYRHAWVNGWIGRWQRGSFILEYFIL